MEPQEGPAQLTVDGGDAEPKRGPGRPRGSRNRKPSTLTAAQVEQGVTLAFGLLAMVKGPHWAATPAEVKPWAGDAAKLLGRVPVAVVEKALDTSSAVAVAVGLGMMVKKRTAIDAATNPRRKAPRTPPQRGQDDANAPNGSDHAEPPPASPGGPPASSQGHPTAPRLKGILA